MGLVARVFPGAALMEETIKVALSLGEKSRGALKTLKRVMDQGLETDLRTGCALELDGFALCFASPDAKEGATAFLEKRPPRFGK
jgi:enoyl-CoA hydratase